MRNIREHVNVAKSSAVLAVVLLASLVLITAPAEARSGSITVNSHGVVVESTLPHCKNEDGSGGPKPCTWNIGTKDGNGFGLAYWLDAGGGTHYVWATDPLVTFPGWEYVSKSPNARCIKNPAGTKTQCPDGTWTDTTPPMLPNRGDKLPQS